MTQILVGTVANDGTGDPLRTAFQKINTSKTEHYNVQSFGAKGNGTTDDTAAIQAAIAAAAAAAADPISGRTGVVVYFPPGSYIYSQTLQVPVLLSGSVTLQGAGMRTTYLYPSGPSTNFSLNSDGDRVCLVFGSLTPDAAGISSQVTQYCGMEDMSQSGSLITSGSVVAHQITEMQYGWMRNSICEAFPNSSIGLYLRGSTITGGLGTGNSGPHVRLCNFINVIVSNIGSAAGTPIAVLLQNADENSFLNCSAAPASGLAGGGADSIFAIWIQLGRNNRWFGCLEQGDTTANKTNYVGIVFGPPVNRAGVPNGQVSLNQFYGDVIEGFDRAVWFRADGSGNTRGNGVINVNPSIVNTNFLDSNTQNGFGEFFTAPILTPAIDYRSGPTPYNDAIGISGATPNVGSGNVFTISQGGAINVTAFTNGANGQRIVIRHVDANTTYVNSANLSMQGGVNFNPGTGAVVSFVNIGGGSWYEEGRRTP